MVYGQPPASAGWAAQEAWVHLASSLSMPSEDKPDSSPEEFEFILLNPLKRWVRLV